MLAAACAVLCAAMAAVTFAQTLHMQQEGNAARHAVAAILPVGQLVFVLSLLWAASSNGMAAPYLLGICAADAVGCVGICALEHSMQQVQSAALNAERERSAQEGVRAAKSHEALLSGNIARTQRLCAQFAAELATLREHITAEDSVADTGCFEGVEDALDNLEEQTRSMYCANKTVNAILSLKAQACRDLGGAFAFEGGVPEDVGIDELELCSVFSNLLDNAINAVHAAAGEGHPHVRVSCAAQGAYLVIKVSNSCAASSKGGLVAGRRSNLRRDPLREHGWGLEIVRDVCTRHDGSFTLERTTATEVAATAILKVAAAS